MCPARFITIILLIFFSSCKQKVTKQKTDSEIVELNNKVRKLVEHIDNPDSSRKAISLLDKLISLDTNNFLGHYNKLMFYIQLKEYNKAIVTINKLITLKPKAHDLYLSVGLFYEKLGDTTSSKAYFTKSLMLCSGVLDTMSQKNRDYEIFMTNKAINLIMLGDKENANQLLKNLSEEQTDHEIKKKTLSMINKSKKELIELLSH